ncbi:hypothetical protein [Thermococcus thioreducens]|uniref:Uncharacterized protein n=1 Tax=Thermococcus thioreducens TaxID=277988 RepID=A0A0Q2UNU0_9EURY|nr:hypothetical protein [Thermococcus thioreducens]ASJ12631.1 hypothetical protein A3L14_06905 [Thermococcus thioreducens]KQH82376.1 hypothetical protein AMR53_05335 [Thermococcus thioreducens]SEV87548.1 hypothetical protein SAMN05216170_0565 [Thermococcus thioreducens]
MTVNIFPLYFSGRMLRVMIEAPVLDEWGRLVDCIFPTPILFFVQGTPLSWAEINGELHGMDANPVDFFGGLLAAIACLLNEKECPQRELRKQWLKNALSLGFEVKKESCFYLTNLGIQYNWYLFERLGDKLRIHYHNDWGEGTKGVVEVPFVEFARDLINVAETFTMILDENLNAIRSYLLENRCDPSMFGFDEPNIKELFKHIKILKKTISGI